MLSKNRSMHCWIRLIEVTGFYSSQYSIFNYLLLVFDKNTMKNGDRIFAVSKSTVYQISTPSFSENHYFMLDPIQHMFEELHYGTLFLQVSLYSRPIR